MKKLNFVFRLSNILFFFFGIMVTVILLWVLYKDPTRITAPALAALTAMCTFLLALWSAFKVNKWLNSKVNEKAFKRTEEFLDSIIDLTRSLAKVYYICNELKHTNLDRLKNDKYLVKEAESYLLDYFNASLTVITYENTFRHWDIKFLREKHHRAIMKRVNNASAIARNLLVLIMNINISKRDSDDLLIIKKASSDIKGLIDSCSPLLDSFIKLKYDQVFDHDKKPTSPTKKASE